MVISSIEKTGSNIFHFLAFGIVSATNVAGKKKLDRCFYKKEMNLTSKNNRLLLIKHRR
jgi:hypothetical protein